MTSNNQLSLVVTTAPALRSRSSAVLASPGCELLTPSASMYTLWPCVSRSRTVCVTQTCASMPTTAISCAWPCALAWPAPPSPPALSPLNEEEGETSAAPPLPPLPPLPARPAPKCLMMAGTHIEKAILSTCSTTLVAPGPADDDDDGGGGGARYGRSSAQVRPSRLRFCVVAYTGMLRILPNKVRMKGKVREVNYS